MAWIWFMTYCLPVRPIVTTTISDAVPITMPSAVRAKRTLLVRKESMAMLTISLKSIVFRAVSARGVLMKILFHTEGLSAFSLVFANSLAPGPSIFLSAKTQTQKLKQRPEPQMPQPSTSSNAFLAIFWGGLVCGILDITQAIVAWHFQTGARPIRIWQSVAVGLLGPKAFQGGMKTA